MDNAADALKMAGSVLLFVLALSIVVPLFAEARITADTIIDYADRESYQNNADDSMDEFFFYVGDDSKKVRTVGLDTIIPAIYRSFKENDKVVFVENAGDDSFEFGTPIVLYTCQYGDINSIDLKYTSIPAGRGNDEKKKQFLNGILYGVFSNSREEFEKEFLPGNDGKNGKEIKTGPGLYGYLKGILDSGGEITEYLGVYYQEDVDSIKGKESSESIEDAINKIPEAQKDEKRVVTYSIN